jgi:hypothetical protein
LGQTVREELLPFRVPRTNVERKTVSSLALTRSSLNKVRKILRIDILQ